VDDDELIARAEQALTQIKVTQGLSEEHEAVLAALRIRLSGTAPASLEEMLAAADDAPSDSLDARLSQEERPPGRSLDDLLQEEPKKPGWPS
jgi:hypothetical protein